MWLFMGNALVIDKLPCMASLILHGMAFSQQKRINEKSPHTFKLKTNPVTCIKRNIYKCRNFIALK